MMKNLLCVLFAIAAFSFLGVRTYDRVQPDPVVGTWVTLLETVGSNIHQRDTFNKDGTGQFVASWITDDGGVEKSITEFTWERMDDDSVMVEFIGDKTTEWGVVRKNFEYRVFANMPDDNTLIYIKKTTENGRETVTEYIWKRTETE